MPFDQYADASLPLRDRTAALLARARQLANSADDRLFSIAATRSFVSDLGEHRAGIDARNTLFDAAYQKARAYLTQPGMIAPGLMLPPDRFFWALEDLAQCAKHPPQRALPLLDAPARLAALSTGGSIDAREWFDAVLVACDAYEPGDFHAVLTIAETMIDAQDRKKRERIRDGRDLMYLEVTRNTGSLWGKPRADWFRREFGR